MEETPDSSEKIFEPTPKRLQDAREKGDVPKSQDLNATAAYLGLFVGLTLCVGLAFPMAASALMIFLEQANELGELFFASDAKNPMALVVKDMLPIFGYIFGTPIAFVIISAVAQKSVTFAPSKIKPKLSRISPVSIAKQKFGASGLFEWFKSFLKLCAFSILLFWFIYSEIENISVTPFSNMSHISVYVVDLFTSFFFIIIVISLVIGGIDYAFQHADHRKKLMMTRKELKDETKENEGDPYLKQERRQRGIDRAMSQQLKDVETADVVVTNPTHYAVALKWDRTPGSAPICVARGTDEFAMVIRQKAQEHDVPLHPDPPTARALFATTQVGDQIPFELYQAVAAAIRFSENARMRAKSLGL